MCASFINFAFLLYVVVTHTHASNTPNTHNTHHTQYIKNIVSLVCSLYKFCFPSICGSRTYTRTQPLPPTHTQHTSHTIYSLFLFSCSGILTITLVELLSHMNMYFFLKCSTKWTEWSLFSCWSGWYRKVKRHDSRVCECRFLVQYVHVQSEVHIHF